MYYYGETLCSDDQFPFFTWDLPSGVWECPDCHSEHTRPGKGERIKCLDCGKVFIAAQDEDSQRLYGLLLLDRAEECWVNEEYKKALTSLRKAEKVFKALLRYGKQFDKEALIDIYREMAYCYFELEDSRDLETAYKALNLFERLPEEGKSDVLYAIASTIYTRLTHIASSHDRAQLYDFSLLQIAAYLEKAYERASLNNKPILENALEQTCLMLGDQMERNAQHEAKEFACFHYDRALSFYRPLLSLYQKALKDQPSKKREKELREKISGMEKKIAWLEARIPENFDADKLLKQGLLGMRLAKPQPLEKPARAKASDSSPEKSSGSVLNTQSKSSETKPGKSLIESAKKEKEKSRESFQSRLARFEEQSNDYLARIEKELAQNESKKMEVSLNRFLAYLDEQLPLLKKDSTSYGPDIAAVLITGKALLRTASLLSQSNPQKALKIYEDLFDRLKSLYSKRLLGLQAECAYQRAALMAEIKKSRQERKVLKKAWQSALEICELVCLESDQYTSLQEKEQAEYWSAQSALSLGQMALQDNQFKKGMHLFKRALANAAKLAQADPDKKTLSLCLEIAEQIADAYRQKNVPDQARKYMAQAMDFKKRLAELR